MENEENMGKLVDYVALKVRTIAGLLPKLKSKKETNDALWAETIKEAAGYVYAANRNNTAGYQPQVANEELSVGSCICPPLLLCRHSRLLSLRCTGA